MQHDLHGGLGAHHAATLRSGIGGESNNARARLIGLIGIAKKTLYLEEEEMQDPQFIPALTTAAHNGVNVEVVLPTGSSDDQGAQQLTQACVRGTGR